MRLTEIAKPRKTPEEKAAINKANADRFNAQQPMEYFTNKHNIEMWMKKKGIEGEVHDDLSITATNYVKLYNQAGSFIRNEHNQNIIPVKIRSCKGFMITSCFIDTMDNMPDEVDGEFYVMDNRLKSAVGGPVKVTGNYSIGANRLRSTEGFAKEIGKMLSLVMNDTIHDLKDFHKHVKRVGGSIVIPGTVRSNILGLCMPLQSGQHVRTEKRKARGRVSDEEIKDLLAAIAIVNTHRDIMDCKEALMELGLKDYAKL